MIDRHTLSLLREVHRCGSVTAAAESLHLTQSAVSHAVRKLEHDYGVKVWEKQGRSLHLTQAGNFLLDLAHRLLPQFDDAERVLSDYAAGRRGVLRLGMECHPCQKWLMEFLSPYLKDWPDVNVDVRTAFRFDGLAALLDAEIDLLITPDPVERPECSFTPIFDYQLLLAVPVGHRLASAAEASPHDLLSEHLITFPVALDRLDIYTRFLLPAHCRPQQRSTVESIDLMVQMVASARGVCVLPDWILWEKGQGLPLHFLRLGPLGLSKTLFFARRKDDGDTDYITALFKLAQERQPTRSSPTA